MVRQTASVLTRLRVYWPTQVLYSQVRRYLTRRTPLQVSSLTQGRRLQVQRHVRLLTIRMVYSSTRVLPWLVRLTRLRLAHLQAYSLVQVLYSQALQTALRFTILPRYWLTRVRFYLAPLTRLPRVLRLVYSPTLARRLLAQPVAQGSTTPPLYWLTPEPPSQVLRSIVLCMLPVAYLRTRAQNFQVPRIARRTTRLLVLWRTRVLRYLGPVYTTDLMLRVVYWLTRVLYSMVQQHGQ